jgi:hypothetical protein
MVPGVRANIRHIEVYLEALSSYVNVASGNPDLSFEEHYRIVASKRELQLVPPRTMRAAAR